MRIYEERKGRNPAYSLRSFARDLNIPAGRLSQYFSEKRHLTEKAGEILAQNLGFEPKEKALFLDSIRQKNALRKGKIYTDGQPIGRLEIDQRNFEILSNPLHFDILSLIETDDFHSDISWIAQRLGQSTAEVRLCLERLVEAELILSEEKQWTLASAGQFRTSDGVASSAIRKTHRKILQDTSRALEEKVDLELRDITAMCLAIDPEKMAEAKKMIRDFKNQFSKVMESGKKKEVYRLGIQFLPVTQRESEKETKERRYVEN